MRNDFKTIALFDDHLAAERAVRALQQSGFDMRKLSILGKDYRTEEHVVGYVNTGDRVKYWGKFGALWGSVWGLLIGSASLVFPGVGPVVILGPLVNTVAGAVLGAGTGALAGALSSIGLPRDAVLRYETAIRAGRFALIAHGTREEAEAARRRLAATEAVEVRPHAPAVQPVGAAEGAAP